MSSPTPSERAAARYYGHDWPAGTEGRYKFCTVGWCDLKHYARGMCHPHYDRWRRTGGPGGPIEPYPRSPRYCTVKGCGRKHYGKGLCKMHYARDRYDGVAGGPEDRRRTHVVNHGTYNEYQNFGCRCDLCRAANTEYYRERRRRKATA